MGRIVTVPEKALFLSLETMTTGRVFEISLPTTGSKDAIQMSPLLIFIPALQIGGFKFSCDGLAFPFSRLIAFLQHLLQFLFFYFLNSFSQGLGNKSAFPSRANDAIQLASHLLRNRNVKSYTTHYTPPSALYFEHILCTISSKMSNRGWVSGSSPSTHSTNSGLASSG